MFSTPHKYLFLTIIILSSLASYGQAFAVELQLPQSRIRSDFNFPSPGEERGRGEVEPLNKDEIYGTAGGYEMSVIREFLQDITHINSKIKLDETLLDWWDNPEAKFPGV